MNILIFDEDERQIPQTCDVLKQLGHQVKHLTKWEKLKEELQNFKPEGLVLDLMLPAINLPSEECGGGYTTGAYVYKTIIHEILPGIPFVVYSATDLGLHKIREAISELEKFNEYRGVLAKGCDEEEIIETLKKIIV